MKLKIKNKEEQKKNIAGINKVFFLILVLLSNLVFSQVKSFPKAEGYGKFSVGGRAGKIIYVTNLNNSGQGSLRAACEASGARIVIFRVAGIINLDSDIKIKNPYITIAGQSAPGDGILLKHSGNANFKTGIIHIATHDVIIRYLKIRRGKGADNECCGDGISIGDINKTVYNLMIDHVSVSWATDELMESWYSNHDVTIQNCFFAEGLYYSGRKDGNDKEIGHSMGPFFGDKSTNFTIFNNIVAHNVDRNIWTFTHREGFTAKFQVVNNLIYNWANFGAKMGRDKGQTNADFIGNYMKSGPDTRATSYELVFWKNSSDHIKAYLEDNLGQHRKTTNNPATEWDIAGEGMSDPAPKTYRSMTRLTNDMPLPILPVMTAYDNLLINSGANKRIDKNGEWKDNRDAVDIRIIKDIITTGPANATHPAGDGITYHGIINDPSEVGGWPVYNTNVTPYPDNDKDGMSDIWEVNNGFNPDDSIDGKQDKDEDGYTNVEEFLNGSDPGNVASVLEFSDSNIDVYPNPTVGIVHLSKASEWRVFTVQGICILKGKGKQIDLSKYSEGVYFLKFEGGNKQIVKIN